MFREYPNILSYSVGACLTFCAFGKVLKDMRNLLVSLTFVIYLMMCPCCGQEYCTNGTSNYTRNVIQYFKESYTEFMQTSIQHSANCGFFSKLLYIFGSRCDTKYSLEYRTKTLYRERASQTSKIECCPGYYSLDNHTDDHTEECVQGCVIGKWGENCTKNCTCSDRVHCDKYNGSCICDTGFTGDNCTEECLEGYYGSNCAYNCACENNSTCDTSNGACNCTSPGWEGDMCSEECTNGTYGLYCGANCTCNDNQTCDHVTGNCTCKAGWTGTNCSQECGMFSFGEGCGQNCTCNESNTELCDHVTGWCHCKPGYLAGNCSEECPMGLYGYNCTETCSTRCPGNNFCDHVTGACICINSTGDNCTEASSSETDEQKSPSGQFLKEGLLYIVGPVAGVLLLIIIAGSVVFYRRERRQSSTDKLDLPLSTAQDNPSYKLYDQENVQLTNGKSDSNLHLYEDTEFETEGKPDIESDIPNSNATDVSDADGLLKFEKNDHVFTTNETKVDETDKDENPSAPKEYDRKEAESQEIKDKKVTVEIESDYAIPDEEEPGAVHIDKRETTFEEFEDKSINEPVSKNDAGVTKGGCKFQAEEIYDSINNDINVTGNSTEYNTFEDVIKMQQKENGHMKKQSAEPDEDYDVLERVGSNKHKPKTGLEHYSTFDEVRKLSLEPNEEDETYNVLNECHTKHRSVPVADSSYHHVSLKYKTVDGDSFTNTSSHLPRETSSKRKIPKLSSLTGTCIEEESIRYSKAENDSVFEEETARVQETVEDIAEAIYDECDLDGETVEENERDNIDNAASNTVKSRKHEIVLYEDCDLPKKDEPRPNSGVLYEDVDEEENSVEEETLREEKTVEESAQNEVKNNKKALKKTFDRNREDYEDFSMF